MCPIHRDHPAIERQKEDSLPTRQLPDPPEQSLSVEKGKEFSPFIRYPELDGFSQQRTLYREDPRRRYVLRQSEVYTLVEIGKFRAMKTEDLGRFLYDGDREKTNHDLRNLREQGLVKTRFVRFPKPFKVVTLTREGARVARKALPSSARQEVYSGLKKVRELRHDTALYSLYQAKAREIEDQGGKVKRVVLDYELKKNINRELRKMNRLEPLEQASTREDIARKHGLQVVEGSVVIPDLRLEYEDRDGNQCRVDLEYLTETYRFAGIAGKAQAGFSLYAPHDQTSRLHRVLDQHQIMAEILAI